MLLNDILLCSKGIYLKNYKILVSYQNLSVQNIFLANYRNICRFISVSHHFAPFKISLLFVLDSYTVIPREIIWWIFRITDKDNIIFLGKQSCLFSDFSKPHYLLLNFFQNLTTYLEYILALFLKISCNHQELVKRYPLSKSTLSVFLSIFKKSNVTLFWLPSTEGLKLL